MYQFVLQELDLYLDIYPDNQDVLNMYKSYLSKKLELEKMYSDTYGVLTLDDIFMDDSWKWASSAWPWEGIN